MAKLKEMYDLEVARDEATGRTYPTEEEAFKARKARMVEQLRESIKEKEEFHKEWKASEKAVGLYYSDDDEFLEE